MTMIAVLTTVDSLDEAQAIARALVERRLAACVQISKIDSVYEWQGAVQSEPEFRLFAKTVKSRYAEVESAILELHSYDLPAVYSIDIEDAHGPYADWVREHSSAR